MHDDVMDGSLTRRGLTTIHTEFAGLHREAGWRGEPRRFGEGVAVLAGDRAAVLADRLLRGAPLAAVELWHELKLEVDVGQYLDLLGTVRSNTDLAAAQRIARYKSRKYTVERPLQQRLGDPSPRFRPMAKRWARRFNRGMISSACLATPPRWGSRLGRSFPHHSPQIGSRLSRRWRGSSPTEPLRLHRAPTISPWELVG